MQFLEDFAINEHERKLTAGMPEQVAVGYVRAMRKAHGGKRTEPDPARLGDILNDMFGKRQP